MCEQEAGDDRFVEKIHKGKGHIQSRGGRAGCELGLFPVVLFPKAKHHFWEDSSLCSASVLSHTWLSLPLRYRE